MIETIKKEYLAKIAIALFIVLTIWWVVLSFSGSKEQLQNYLFGASYGLMAVLGGVAGIRIARHWGGSRSIMGKAILLLSFGLLAEEYGQIIFSYYNIFAHIEVPYPSLADIGFFGNIPLYTIGIILLAQASGIHFSLKKLSSKIQAVFIPIIMLVFSYFFFLQKYEFDWSNPIKIFLDFGYPLGQAFYVSLAFLTYSLSKGILGGVMKNKILFLIIALVVQYLSDYNFLFQSNRGTWVNGGYGDYLYLLAYFLMTLGIIQLNTVLEKIRG